MLVSSWTNWNILSSTSICESRVSSTWSRAILAVSSASAVRSSEDEDGEDISTGSSSTAERCGEPASQRAIYHQRKWRPVSVCVCVCVCVYQGMEWTGLIRWIHNPVQSSGFGLNWIRNSPTQRILDWTGSRNVKCVSHI